MKELLTEFFASILSEAKPKKPAQKKPAEDPKPSNAKFTTGGRWYTADPESGGEYVGRMDHGKWLDATPEEKEEERQKRGATQQPKGAQEEPATEPMGDEEETTGRKGKKEPSIAAAYVARNMGIEVPAPEFVGHLVETNKILSKARRKGLASGIGGAVPSYGEVGLTDAANQFSEGYDRWRKQHAAKIERTRKQIVKEQQAGQLKNLIPTVAKQLGMSEDDDRVYQYLAERRVFEEQELARLRADKKGIYYLTGKKGFGSGKSKKSQQKAEKAAREWARAQFDGAMATLTLVREQSTIDTTKPFTVIQSDTREGGHDIAILAHLKARLGEAETDEDKAHYEEQIRAFQELGFHDTMVIGVDESDRMTVFHISNKKDDDLRDIWNNSSPIVAIAKLRKSLTSKLAGMTPKISAKLLKVLDDGVESVTNLVGALGKQFTSAEPETFDDAFCDYMADLNSGKLAGADKDYVGVVVNSDAFQKWLRTSGKNLPENVRRNLVRTKSNSARAVMRARLLAIQMYTKQEFTDKGQNPPRSVIRIMTKAAEVHKKLPQERKDVLSESPGMSFALDMKEQEKDVMKQVHTKVVSELAKADKGAGYPPKKGNGPYTQSYIGTILHSMHFDSMVINFDKSLGVVTGIRGSTPADFRTCLARLSGYKGDTDTEEGRQKLVKHLLQTCRLEPTSGAIIITDGDKKHVLAEDTWRTSGPSKKVEKKIGDTLRGCVKDSVDSRAKERASRG